MVMLHIRLKEITKWSNLVAYILHADHDPRGRGQKVKAQLFQSIFLKYGHVAYQIKASNECGDMVANIFPQTPYPHPDPGDGWLIGQNSIFPEHGHVAYRIKWNP